MEVLYRRLIWPREQPPEKARLALALGAQLLLGAVLIGGQPAGLGGAIGAERADLVLPLDGDE
jgi:hypothetical protein